MQPQNTLMYLFLLGALALLFLAIIMLLKVRSIRKEFRKSEEEFNSTSFKNQLASMKYDQVDALLKIIRKNQNIVSILVVAFMLIPSAAVAQSAPTKPLLGEAGIIITIVLLLIPVTVALALLVLRVAKASSKYTAQSRVRKAGHLADYMKTLAPGELEHDLQIRKSELEYSLSHKELSGDQPAQDSKGVLSIKDEMGLPFVARKRRAALRTPVDPELSKLVLWYLICATIWLLFGTTIGEYVGIKFVAPDADHLSWLSFGRLRPVHTNAVFWGWASLGMLGLGYSPHPLRTWLRSRNP